MKKFLLLFLFAVVGCSKFSHKVFPDYTTVHGIHIYDHTTVQKVSPKELEDIIHYVVRHVPKAERLKGYKLILVNKWVEIPKYKSDEVRLADGYTNPFDRIMVVSVFQDCFADSGLPHELAHVLHDFGMPDWWHDDKKYWGWVKNFLEPQIIKDLCPADHVHKEIPPDYVPPEVKDGD